MSYTRLRPTLLRCLLVPALAGLIGCGGSPKKDQARAPEAQPAPAAHDAAETPHDAARPALPQSTPDLWKAVQAGRVELDRIMADGQLNRVHGAAFWVRDLVNALPGDALADGAARTRLNDAQTRVAQIATALDESGDSGDKAGVATQLVRLDGVLALIKGLYPADQVPALEYVCPMHPEVRQGTPGNCPKCGMHLVPDAASAPEGADGHGHDGHAGAAHTDHSPKHGGQFAMQGDHHLEFVTAADGRMSVYVYDAWTKPMGVSGAKGSVTLELTAADGSTRETTATLTPDGAGQFLTATSPDLARATAATVELALPDTSLSMTFPLPGGAH